MTRARNCCAHHSSRSMGTKPVGRTGAGQLGSHPRTYPVGWMWLEEGEGREMELTLQPGVGSPLHILHWPQATLTG